MNIEEKLKEYAAKADKSDMVNAIHSAGSKIASAGKKVGKLAYDHPFITTAIIYAISLKAQPHIMKGFYKISNKREKMKNERTSKRY